MGRKATLCQADSETTVGDGLGRNLSKRPHSIDFCRSRGKNKLCNLPKVDSRSCCERSEHINVQQRAISIPARRRTGSHIEHLPKLVTEKYPGFHFQGGMASIKSRFESHELLNLVHLGDKSLCKVTFSVEALKKSLLREWVKIPQDTLRAAVEAFPDRLKKVVGVKGGYIE